MKKKCHFIVLLSLFIVFTSCHNDLDTIKKVSFKPTDPDERTTNVHMIETDSGYAKIELRAKLSETYNKPTFHVKFKEGIEITLYNQMGEIESKLTSLFGEIFQETGEMIFKDSVRLQNLSESQVLETEELHWNQNTQAIFTDKNVIVHSKDGGKFYGDGIRTSLDFKKYEFIHPKGKFKLN